MKVSTIRELLVQAEENWGEEIVIRYKSGKGTVAEKSYTDLRKDSEHFYFDLSGYLEDKIHNLGIDNVVNSHIDTYPAQNGYFSYRRNTHLGLISQPKDYPTQYSFICL